MLIVLSSHHSYLPSFAACSSKIQSGDPSTNNFRSAAIATLEGAMLETSRITLEQHSATNRGRPAKL